MILVVAASFTGFSHTTTDLEQNSNIMVSDDITFNVVIDISDLGTNTLAITTPSEVKEVIASDYLYINNQTLEESAIELSLTHKSEMDNQRQSQTVKFKKNTKSKFWTTPIDNYLRNPRDGLSYNLL
nr:hypothetical protein [uncultured Allomuricauda sp.]